LGPAAHRTNQPRLPRRNELYHAAGYFGGIKKVVQSTGLIDDLADVSDQFTHRLVTLSRLFSQSTVNHRRQPRWYLLVELHRSCMRLGEQRADNVRGRPPRERNLPGRHFVEDTAEGKDVASVIYAFAPGLLRRHRGGRAHHLARHRQMRVGLILIALEQPGKAEVKHLRLALRRDDDVA
jgi:hypothetical protein